MPQDHWLPGFNFNVEESFADDRHETLAICRSLEAGPRRIRNLDREEARRQVHDP
jgi:hypothetical protein